MVKIKKKSSQLLSNYKEGINKIIKILLLKSIVLVYFCFDKLKENNEKRNFNKIIKHLETKNKNFNSVNENVIDKKVNIKKYENKYSNINRNIENNIFDNISLYSNKYLDKNKKEIEKCIDIFILVLSILNDNTNALIQFILENYCTINLLKKQNKKIDIYNMLIISNLNRMNFILNEMKIHDEQFYKKLNKIIEETEINLKKKDFLENNKIINIIDKYVTDINITSIEEYIQLLNNYLSYKQNENFNFIYCDKSINNDQNNNQEVLTNKLFYDYFKKYNQKKFLFYEIDVNLIYITYFHDIICKYGKIFQNTLNNTIIDEKNETLKNFFFLLNNMKKKYSMKLNTKENI